MLSPKVGNKARMPALTTLTQQSIGSSRHCSRQEREVKVYSLKERKKENYLYLQMA